LALGRRNDFGVKECEDDAPVVKWLLVYGAAQLFEAIKSIWILKIYISSPTPVQSKGKLDIFYCCTFFNFRVAWLIYGNCFAYTNETLWCKNYHNDFRSLWILMIVLLAFGYIIFALYSLLVCCLPFIVCLFCLVRSDSSI
jgi:hypothetical protein